MRPTGRRWRRCIATGSSTGCFLLVHGTAHFLQHLPQIIRRFTNLINILPVHHIPNLLDGLLNLIFDLNGDFCNINNCKIVVCERHLSLPN